MKNPEQQKRIWSRSAVPVAEEGTLAHDFYASWHRRVRPPTQCEEAAAIPERWLQQIWRHQRLRRDGLRLADGRDLKVLHPGFWNREPGPDFRKAVLRMGDHPPITGDVEVDREESGWRDHRHVDNPAYSKVILHVVWKVERTESTPPLLALEPHLDLPLRDLAGWLDEEAASCLPPSIRGNCSTPLASVPDKEIGALLNQAAALRLRSKAGEFGIRGRIAGWERALWEGLFAGLGYKHNSWPMRRIAELVVTSCVPTAPLVAAEAGQSHSAELGWEARLLGLAGMLPTPGTGQSKYLRSLWEVWWHERAAWMDHVPPSNVWHLAGIRPANHPQRRLALAARWLAQGTLVESLVRWISTPFEVNNGPEALRTLLEPPSTIPHYWNTHWTLRSGGSPSMKPLLGAARTTDLAVNVILPWLYARAKAGPNPEVLSEVEKRFFLWPASEDNAALRLARQRLMGIGPKKRMLRTASHQQGLLQIHRDFCEPAGALCTQCRFPELVRGLKTAGKSIDA